MPFGCRGEKKKWEGATPTHTHITGMHILVLSLLSFPFFFVLLTTVVLHKTETKNRKGVMFDPDIPHTIRLEFAKSNTKVSKPQNSSPPAAAPHPTLLQPLTGREYLFSFFIYFFLSRYSRHLTPANCHDLFSTQK